MNKPGLPMFLYITGDLYQQLLPPTGTLMQDPMTRHPFLPEGDHHGCRPVLRGIGSEVAQRTDISSVEGQNGSILSTLNPGLGCRVGERDMR
jgi:hypothetical protein